VFSTAVVDSFTYLSIQRTEQQQPAITTMRVVHQIITLFLLMTAAVAPALARRGGPFHISIPEPSPNDILMISSPATTTATTTSRPFDRYGPIWGVNTMWNIECHDLSHVNEELSHKMRKVQQVKRAVQEGECVFCLF
jgi:hypothetical protein